MLSKADKKFMFETFATKKDLEDLATQADLQEMRDEARETYVTKVDLSEMYEYLEGRFQNYATKEEMFSRFDAVMVELKAIREDLAAVIYRQNIHSEQIDQLNRHVGLA